MKKFLNYKLIFPMMMIISAFLWALNPISLVLAEHTVVMSEKNIQTQHPPIKAEKQDLEKKETQQNPTPGSHGSKEQPQETLPTEKPENQEAADQKVAYLTFDDGPSPGVTSAILDILNKYQIKATFFVIGTQVEAHPDLLKRVAHEGHLIASHGYSHDYKYIYANSQNFLADMGKNEKLLDEVLPHRSKNKIIRFPGGSFGKNKAPMRQAAKDAGYHSIDWNVLSGDAEGLHIPPAKQLQRLQETLQHQKSAVILMHDAEAKKSTAEALPRMIEYLQAQGYVFKTLADYEF